jgi:hypothetical protein
MATLIELTKHEYEALLNWARVGAAESEQTDAFLALRKRVDWEHDIRRYTIVIRFDHLPTMPAPGITETPKGNLKMLELLRPPTREDVMTALEGENFNQHLVWVTADPEGEVGWYDLDHFPW